MRHQHELLNPEISRMSWKYDAKFIIFSSVDRIELLKAYYIPVTMKVFKIVHLIGLSVVSEINSNDPHCNLAFSSR